MTELSGYRLMWIVTLFDLPVLTKPQRKAATKYRKNLLDEGFQMVQLSVYFKHCRDREQANAIAHRVSTRVPPGGKVDIMMITDKQYSSILSIQQGRRFERENPPQLALF